MAPSGRTTTSRTKTRTRRRRTGQPRRTHFKKQKQQQQQQQQHPQSKTQEIPTVLPTSCSSISSQDSSKDGDMGSEVIDASTSACSTPKGQKFRIPEISTCPPAPKKPRVLSNCSLRRSPLSFFAPPDLELFFFVAL